MGKHELSGILLQRTRKEKMGSLTFEEKWVFIAISLRLSPKNYRPNQKEGVE